MFINPHARLLIIDDRDEDMLFLLVKDMRIKFPDATIHAVEGFKGIEEKITYGNYDVILLDKNLRHWGMHRIFGSDGINLIPFIRKMSPVSKIIGVSNHPFSNQLLLRAGADDCILKDEILSSLSEEKKLMVA